MLLERGVSVDSCRAALPEWMEMNQWLLVARAMEYDVDDAGSATSHGEGTGQRGLALHQHPDI